MLAHAPHSDVIGPSRANVDIGTLLRFGLDRDVPVPGRRRRTVQVRQPKSGTTRKSRTTQLVAKGGVIQPSSHLSHESTKLQSANLIKVGNIAYYDISSVEGHSVVFNVGPAALAAALNAARANLLPGPILVAGESHS